MVQGFAHAGLYVTDPEKAACFYEQVFGAENLGWFTASAHGCWLKLGEDILEIFESHNLGDGSFKHIAIACDDVDALFAKARDHGAEPMVAPKDICLGLREPVNARIAFVRGLCGEQIELFCRREG